jgi:hypothetical protein
MQRKYIFFGKKMHGAQMHIKKLFIYALRSKQTINRFRNQKQPDNVSLNRIFSILRFSTKQP